ncbi:MAG: hypothetical protein P4L86_23435 [Mycobacterium sp.]|nr:hypothetical protein [Mycobacterium sp.]
MSESNDAGQVGELQPPQAPIAADAAARQPAPVGSDLEDKTQFVDRSAFRPSTAEAAESTQFLQQTASAVPATPWQPPLSPVAANPYGQESQPAVPQWQPPAAGYQPPVPQPQFGQPGMPVPPQPQQWNAPPGYGAPVPPGYGAGYGTPMPQSGFGPGAPVPPPGFGTAGAPMPPQPGFGPAGGPTPPPGYGPSQPGGFPGGPQFPGQMGPQQTPVDMAKSLLNKGDSFIFRLMSRGVRGELIQQPWFQGMRSNPQGSNQFVYIGYAGAILLGLLVSLLGGFIGAIFALALWLGVAYCFLALGSKLAAQFVAYGICGVGAAAGLLGLLMSLIAISEVDKYLGGSYALMLVLAAVVDGAIAIILGYLGIQVHKGIQKIASGQF